MNVVPFQPKHLEAIIALCRDEEWPSFLADRDRTLRVLTLPGVTAVVAVENDEVLGFAYVQSDGAIQAHLSLIAVSRAHRRRGIGRLLVREAFARCGAERIDLVSTEENDGFYESFAHRRFVGYRIYPDRSGGPRS
jgi:ribosomal protein S18 acetylase RimI-like enzyme